MKTLLALILSITSAQAGSVYIDQVGNGNDLYISQYGMGDHRSIMLNEGNNNDLSIIQQDSGDHTAFIGTPPLGIANGSYVTTPGQGNHGNDFTIYQKDSGDHTAFIGTPPLGIANGSYVTTPGQGNHGNDFTIYQKDSGDHTAAINLDHSVVNSNNSAVIDQEGAAIKQFTLNLSGSNIGVTVIQDNPTTADSGSMSIQCYTGTCQGYTYTKH